MAYQVDKSKIVISIKTGSTSGRDLIASWAGAKEIAHTKSFNVIWQYWANGGWVAQTSSTPESQNTSWNDLQKSIEWTAPNDATKVRIQVKPISDTHKVDNSDKNYYEGDWSGWSSVFSAWDKTAKPPSFKIEKKEKKDYFRIVKSTAHPGDLTCHFDLKKSRIGKFLNFLTGFAFKWEAWNGSEWASVNAWETFINYNSDGKNAPGSGLVNSGEAIIVSDQVKAAIRSQNSKDEPTVQFRSYIHPSSAYLTYRVTVTPASDNEYGFDPIDSVCVFDYKPSRLVFKTKNISIIYDEEEDQFEASWMTMDFDKFSQTINHVSGFDVEWTYMKPEVIIWQNATGEAYNPAGGVYIDPVAKSENIAVDSYTEYTVQTQVPVEVPVDRFGNVRAASTAGLNGISLQTVYNTVDTPVRKWVSTFQLPEGARRDTPIRFRIKVKGDNDQAFREEWSSWKDFTHKIDKRSVNMATVRPQVISQRKLDAFWTIASVLQTSGFSYQWYYMLKSDTQWRDGSSGTIEVTNTTSGVVEVTEIESAHRYYMSGEVEPSSAVDLTKPNSEYSESIFDVVLVNRQTPLYVWRCSYDAPAEAASVMFTVTPNPLVSGAYIGSPLVVQYEITIPTLTVDASSVEINVDDAEQRVLIATWDNFTFSEYEIDLSDYISGYECRWEYLLNNIWRDQSGTAAYTKLNIEGVPTRTVDPFSTFTVPENVSEVRFIVKPTPTQDDIFKGVWTDYKYFKIIPTILKLDEGEDIDDVLEMVIRTTGDRVLSVKCLTTGKIPVDAWPVGARAEDKQITFQWVSRSDGVWTIDQTTDVPIGYSDATHDFANDTYTVPEEADIVQVRVMPKIDNINYIGDWSDYQYFELSLAPYVIQDIEVDMLPGSRTTAFATWLPTNLPEGKTLEKYIESFSIQWEYYFGGMWWPEDISDVSAKDTLSSNVTRFATTYSPSQVGTTAVAFRIMANPKNSLYFKPEWSDETPLDIPLDNIPDVPSTPSVELSRDGYTIFVSVDFTDTRTAYIDIVALAVDQDAVYDGDFEYSGATTIYVGDNFTNTASWQFVGKGGTTYHFRARALNEDGEYKTPELGDYTTNEGGWSAWSQLIGTKPAPVKITSVKALTSSNIQVDWTGGTIFGSQDEATDYIVERTQKEYYFDASTSNVTSSTEAALGDESQSAIYTGLEPGNWFFRVAVKQRNSEMQSDWSNIASCTIGKKPTPPTTWSNKTVAMVGEALYLYWTHNSEDNSEETDAIIEYTINGISHTETLHRDEDDTTQRSFEIPSEYLNSEAIIQWKVKTQGAYGSDDDQIDGFSDWSTQRIIKIYSAPSVQMNLFGATSAEWDSYIDEHSDSNGVYDYNIPGTSVLSGNLLRNFPLFVRLSSSPVSQEPIAYALTITANNTYESSDSTGRRVNISTGTTVFRRYFNTSQHQFSAMIMPGDVQLENGMSYTINATVAMNSGLTAESSLRFSPDFEVDEYNIDASIGIDKENFIAFIKPYCLNDDNSYITTVTLAVYRRQFDGGFVKIADNIPGNLQPVITDPHPSLDYARYRIVAVDKATGHVSYQDLPGHPIKGTSIIIQWDEDWSSYYEIGEGLMAERPWHGSIIKLPYNIDTTDTNVVDVEMVEYIGRDHPVSYYGTQIGQKATWNALIPITDKQTIYDLRRLARYMGNAYVREPSGTGYWAHVEVSFNLTHLETTVPVSLSITRVEGGM